MHWAILTGHSVNCGKSHPRRPSMVCYGIPYIVGWVGSCHVVSWTLKVVSWQCRYLTMWRVSHITV